MNSDNIVLQINDLNVRYDTITAVDSFSLTLRQGEISCLLGPSGCGKTTVLRSIAGFEKPHHGEIYLHNTAVNKNQWMLPTEQRQVGMVFQDFALFPHLNVFDNVAFGLTQLDKSEKKIRVEKLLALIELENIAKKFPHELSGGQQQRIALARALAPNPKILLLDEPFSNIDIEMREQLTHDVADILRQENITTLMVTHDQLEAFSVADTIGVMNQGRLHQWDNAFNLYHKPKDLFVADFIGQGTLINGTVRDNQHVETEFGIIGEHEDKSLNQGDDVYVLIRPDDIIHDDDSTLTAVIIEKSFRGAEFLYTLKLPTGGEVLCLAPSHHDHHIDEHIGIRLEMDHLITFKKMRTL